MFGMERKVLAEGRLLVGRQVAIIPTMTTLAELERLALELPHSQRALFASHLLRSLPSVLHDGDDGLAEALRRDAELDANPALGTTLEQLDQQIGAHQS